MNKASSYHGCSPSQSKTTTIVRSKSSTRTTGLLSRSDWDGGAPPAGSVDGRRPNFFMKSLLGLAATRTAARGSRKNGESHLVYAGYRRTFMS